jgi:hypothetical protein
LQRKTAGKYIIGINKTNHGLHGFSHPKPPGGASISCWTKSPLRD